MIKSFTIFNIHTGEILRWGECQSSVFKQQILDEFKEDVIEGNYENYNYYILDKTPIKKNDKPTDGGEYFFNYTTKSWCLDSITTLDNIKRNRNNLLSSSDFSQLPDSPLTSEQKQAWAEYRQQLRDYPATIVDPLNPPPFPTKPS